MGAPDCPAESSPGQRQNHSLQCSLVHGFGRLHCYPPEQQLEKASKQSQMNLREGGGAPREFLSWVTCGFLWQVAHDDLNLLSGN